MKLWIQNKVNYEDRIYFKIYNLYERYKSYGYPCEIKVSGLSDSTYLVVGNISIRFSDHDLPPSYYGRYEPFDYDVSVFKNRNGTYGEAIPYSDFLKILKEIYPAKRGKLPEWCSDDNLQKILDYCENHRVNPHIKYGAMIMLGESDDEKFKETFNFDSGDLDKIKNILNT